MSTELTTRDAIPAGKTIAKSESLLTLMADQYHLDRSVMMDTLKRTIFPNGTATSEQMVAFCAVAHFYNLNPFLREIFAFPAKGGGIVPIVSVDGWLKIINRHPELASLTVKLLERDGKVYGAECTMKRRDRDDPTTITEYIAECKRDTEPWRQMPSRMIRHKAIKECARVVFGFGGLYDEDEGRVIAGERPVKPAIADLNAELRGDQRQLSVASATTDAELPAPEAEPEAQPETPESDPDPKPRGVPLKF